MPLKQTKDLTRLADEELMRVAQSGDPRAFELLYDRHGGAAFSLAYRMVGTRAVAEDIVQEAFLSIWRSKVRYERERASVRTWVLGIVHHRTIDALRRNLVHERRRASAEGIEERLGARELTDVEAVRREEAREVRAAVGARRRACARRFLEGGVGGTAADAAGGAGTGAAAGGGVGPGWPGGGGDSPERATLLASCRRRPNGAPTHRARWGPAADT